MKERRLLYNQNPSDDQVNISPLIDVVFILLIFFIVTTVFVEETGVEVQRPAAASASMLEKNTVLIAINEDGKVYHGGREVGVRGVRGAVKKALTRDKDTPVIIQADKSASIEIYTKVHDEAALAGAIHINLATVKN